jgi:hypothetical protein
METGDDARHGGSGGLRQAGTGGGWGTGAVAGRRCGGPV